MFHERSRSLLTDVANTQAEKNTVKWLILRAAISARMLLAFSLSIRSSIPPTSAPGPAREIGPEVLVLGTVQVRMDYRTNFFTERALQILKRSLVKPGDRSKPITNYFGSIQFPILLPTLCPNRDTGHSEFFET